MINELDQVDFERAWPLFEAMDHHLAIRSILAGATPAPVYVDDPVEPKAAITWAQHRVFLAGDATHAAFNGALSRLLTEHYVPQAVAAGRRGLVLFCSPDGWERQIDLIFKGRSPVRGQRLYYALKTPTQDWRALIQEGFVLRQVDEALLAETHLKNLDALTTEMCSERPSVKDFLDRSFGVCLLHDKEIVGWCLSEYNLAQRCEIGIATVRAYQRQGVATITASALIAHALTDGITHIGWHCWADNVGSMAVAEKVGFERVMTYPAFYVSLDA
jgi:GNAT superfamily N-acetyltransferase